MSRFSDIRRGTQLKAALDKYVTYLSTPRIPNLNSRGARPASRGLYVVPFSFDLATDEVIAVRAPVEGWNTLKPFINASGGQSEALELIGSKNAVTEPGFRPARVVHFRNTTRSVTVATSDITGSKYLKYSGERYQAPFGRKVAADNMIDAYNAIEALVKAQTGFEILRCSLVPERVSGK